MEIMNNLHPFKLTPQQERAIQTRGRDVLITAGAGSGKTLTLVACYLEMLSHGFSPRQIAAITFTEKAAREMRNRVRAEVARMADGDDDRAQWQFLAAQMDGARIGTIHSLCAEILRTHPAEAEIDPAFEVVEEGIAAAMKVQAVEDALAWATVDSESAGIFRSFSPHRLANVLRYFLDHRLDAQALLDDPLGMQRGEAAVQGEIDAFVQNPEVLEILGKLRSLRDENQLFKDAGEKLTVRIEALLEEWSSLVRKREDAEAGGLLFQLRRKHLLLGTGKRDSEAKALLRELQRIYDEQINPWLGGAKSSDPAPDEAVDTLFRENLPRLKNLFHHAHNSYLEGLKSRFALDFDDLEIGALRLLAIPVVGGHWRAALTAVLVDEFQDTNARQQKIVDYLRDEPGSLFVVGDSRQSIYRFRGADVTVFRKLKDEVKEQGGELVELDMTFRAHPRLLAALDDLLAPVLGIDEGPLYRVPFAPLKASRNHQREGVQPAFVEIHFGLGGSAAEARSAAAQNLVQRLIELKQSGEINEWDDVALLFRASTGFQFYEDALESMGVPFVTIAGRGYYDRPEVREVLNMLRALADPGDDLAMAGLLRSPAFGLSDEALYHLRWGNGALRPILAALDGDLTNLADDDRQHAARAHTILSDIIPMVDRLPVAELLNSLIAHTDYRAALVAAHSRMWRNLDKLVQDAHRSGLVRVRAFLDYVKSLRDVGAREGEAPADESGAVRLMTIHKAKGLQFNFVVLADASRRSGGQFPIAYLLPETGVAVHQDRVEGSALVMRMARYLDKLQAQAEEDRLLYVALTRSREKLLISGHISQTQRGLRVDGWLKEILEIVGADADTIINSPSQWHSHELPGGEMVGVRGGSEHESITPWSQPKRQWPDSNAIPLYLPLPIGLKDEADADEDEELLRDWRATGERIHPPAAAVGQLVHEAIRSWLLPDDPELSKYLETLAINEGLVEVRQREQALQETLDLFKRFWGDTRRIEIDNADEVYHELPFTRPLSGNRMDSGDIDLLFRDQNGWTIVDFKTDELKDEQDLTKAIAKHRPQLERYEQAAKVLLKTDVILMICFLDFMGHIEWETL